MCIYIGLYIYRLCGVCIGTCIYIYIHGNIGINIGIMSGYIYIYKYIYIYIIRYNYLENIFGIFKACIGIYKEYMGKCEDSLIYICIYVASTSHKGDVMGYTRDNSEGICKGYISILMYIISYIDRYVYIYIYIYAYAHIQLASPIPSTVLSGYKAIHFVGKTLYYKDRFLSQVLSQYDVNMLNRDNK